MTFRPMAAVGALLLAGCGAGNGLSVTVSTTPGRAETCYEVELLDETGQPQASVRFPRQENRATYLVGVERGSLPVRVQVRARALIGADCASASLPNGVSSIVDTQFNPKGIVTVALSLTAGDVDSDGFVSTDNGGADCSDGDARVNPGAKEQCSGQVDRNCDGRPSCSDPQCAGQPCAGVATQLSLDDVPAVVRAGDCTPFTLTVRDAQGQGTSPSTEGPVTFSGPAQFFAGEGCQGAAVTQALLTAVGRFSFIATAPGVATLTAAAPALASDSALLTVQARPPLTMAFTSPPARVAAGVCSPALVLSLLDDAGLPAVPPQPVPVALSSDAGLPFSLYSDEACQQQAQAAAFLDAGTLRLYFSGQKAGGFGVGAFNVELGEATQRAMIDPGAVTQVQWSSDAGVVLTAGSCSGPWLVQAFDAFGNEAPVTQVSVSEPTGTAVFTSSTCATPGASSQFGLRFDTEGVFAVTVTVNGVSATQNVLVRGPGPAGSQWRWPLEVRPSTRTPAGGYQGFTYRAEFDTRDDVDAGRISADGRSLRLFFFTGTGWREVDRLVEGLNTGATVLRFKGQTDLDAGAVDRRYSLFSGPFDGGAPAQDPDGVYLFADDFERGTLAGKWQSRDGGGRWEVAVTDAGTRALRYPAENNIDAMLDVQPALSETDVRVDARWSVSMTTDADFSQCVRTQPGLPITHVESNLEDQAGWSLATVNTGVWSQLAAPSRPPTTNAWTRITVVAMGDTVTVFRDLQALGSATLPGAFLGPGSVGLRKRDVGGAGVWLDDVTVRRFTTPEPVVTVGGAFLTP